jgi:hypothetical protein
MGPRLPKGPSATDFVRGGQKFSSVSAPQSESIILATDALEWQIREGGETSLLRTLHPGSSVFSKFLRLASDQKGSAILAFARKHGVLGLCQHGIPICHGISSRREDESVGFRAGGRIFCRYAFRMGHSKVIEPLESWRRLSSSASSLLHLRFSFAELSSEERKKHWLAARWLCDCLRERCGQNHFRPVRDAVELTEETCRQLIPMVSNLWLRIPNHADQHSELMSITIPK